MIENNIVYTVFPGSLSEENGQLRPTLPPIDKKEALRYAGYALKTGRQPKTDPELEALFEETASEAEKLLDYKLCFMKSDISGCGFLQNFEETLKKPSEYIMFAATVGHGIDRLIARYERLRPVKAVLLQGIGAERVEAVCDSFCQEISRMYSGHVTGRVSPGYGKLKLEWQKDFFDILDINRKLGISLSDSLLMTPSKSVTAVFGIYKIER